MIEDENNDRLFGKLRRLEQALQEALAQLEEETPDGEAVTLVRERVTLADGLLAEVFAMCWDVEKR